MGDNTTSVCCTFCGMILHDGEQCGCSLSTKSIEIMQLRAKNAQLASELAGQTHAKEEALGWWKAERERAEKLDVCNMCGEPATDFHKIGPEDMCIRCLYGAWIVDTKSLQAKNSEMKKALESAQKDASDFNSSRKVFREKFHDAESRADSLAVELVDVAKDTVRLKRIYVNLPTSAKARADKEKILAKATAILDREKEGK